ncbi:predicted protein [Naegleria gruberi]|uniref:Predicted protein n=1 Tax=Naegleria gruberi TaxID=5762 RepID=D2VU14_NAEGR|nr:uncharacterized protein NAEGRDRAFT_81228 [Naegleria gruberi]EFC39754.1 predicted protein [Naegleria gruberi]|eukprot:XP_002672498.1 predicted protein [Naegleria gruberi strain NEG-M]
MNKRRSTSSVGSSTASSSSSMSVVQQRGFNLYDGSTNHSTASSTTLSSNSVSQSMFPGQTPLLFPPQQQNLQQQQQVLITATKTGHLCTEQEEETRLQYLFQKYYNLEKRHRIEMQWYGHPISNNNNCPAMVDILVTSRKLKNEETSPTEVLFKTHSYEIKLIPNEYFFEWNGGKKSGYNVELKLFKKAVSGKKKKGEESQEVYNEHTDCGVPLISYTYTEDVFTNSWILNLIWPDEKTKTSFRGDFYFSISVYRKIDEDTFRRLFTRVSSRFKIVSKPGVYLSKKRKKSEEDEEVSNEVPSSKKLQPPQKVIPPNSSSSATSTLLLPSLEATPMPTSNSNLNTIFTNTVHDASLFLPLPQTIKQQPLSQLSTQENLLSDNQFFAEMDSNRNLMQPPITNESTKSVDTSLKIDNSQLKPSFDNLFFSQASQPFLSFSLIEPTPKPSSEEINPFSPITPHTPSTPNGIFGEHQQNPQKGVLTLNFSQEGATENDWWFYNTSQLPEKEAQTNDDFYHKMLEDTNNRKV